LASFERSDRVAEAIKREVGDLLLREVKDPRVHFATVTDVEVTHDLRDVKIFVSVMGPDTEKVETMAGLEAAKGFIRREIGRRVRLRFTPDIGFYLDKSLDHAMRINELLQTIHKPEENNGTDNVGKPAPQAEENSDPS